jgi:predicted permease
MVSRKLSSLVRTLLQDWRYGWRMLARNPGFSAVAVLTLALGIGANTAIFSVVNAILVRPLPYRNPEQLVWVWEKSPQGRQAGVAPATFLDWREQSRLFEQLAAYDFEGFSLTGVAEPESVVGAWASANFFLLLGVEAALGRTFSPSEDRPGGERVVVLSHSLWQRRFGADPEIIGRRLTLNGESFTVVGVLPRQFWFMLGTVELWVPLVLNTPQLHDRAARSFDVIARPKPGVTLEQAQAEMETIARRIAQAYPQTNDGWGVTINSVEENFLRFFRPALFLLLGAVSLVLLIACANVANLLLARAVARQKEIAIRAALGASRLRLIRQLLTESVMLSGLGGAAGLLLAHWSLRLVIAFMPGELDRRTPGGLEMIGFDARVLGFTLGVSLLTGLIFGLAPAFQSSRPDLNETLKEGGGTSSGGFRPQRLRHLLVIAEIALALVLLIGAGLMLKSFARMQQADLGFQPERLLRMGLPLNRFRPDQQPQKAAFLDEVLRRIAALPGAQAAAVANDLIPPPWATGSPFTIEGRPAASPSEAPLAVNRAVSPGYFRALEIPLRAGRDFTERDTAEAPGLVIISQNLAERFWPGEDPLGKRLRLGGPQADGPWLTIAGVAGDVRHPLSPAPKPVIYRPLLQTSPAWVQVFARTAPDPASLIAAARKEIWAASSDQPISGVGTMEQMLAEYVAEPRFIMTLLSLFAGLALALAAVGIYGVMSYAVSQRTRELGIRLALGAQAGDIFRLVVGQGLALALIGVGIGLAAAFALTRLLTGFLVDVRATDPATFAVIALLLTVVAGLACYLPARRATKVDPMTALRSE